MSIRSDNSYAIGLLLEEFKDVLELEEIRKTKLRRMCRLVLFYSDKKIRQALQNKQFLEPQSRFTSEVKEKPFT